MQKIKELFDPKKGIYRTIEKVITYGASQEHRLKTEIGEYVVTENIDADFEKLIGKMQAAMDMGGENEIGVWVFSFLARQVARLQFTDDPLDCSA